MALIGYARVSTADQNLDLQTDALTQAGAERIFTDHVSGSKTARPGLDQCLDYLRAGDTLIIWKLDRLGRSTRHLIELVEQFRDRDVNLIITTMGVDTRTPVGKMVFTIFAAFAEFERDLIRERTYAGLTAARARGRVGGRKRTLNAKQAQHARDLYAMVGEDGKRAHTVQEIAYRLRVPRTTVYGYLGKGQGS